MRVRSIKMGPSKGVLVLVASLLHLSCLMSSHRTQIFASSANVAKSSGSSRFIKRAASADYFGTLVGQLKRNSNGATGAVYAVDEQTLFVRSLTYDGLAGDTYFWSSVISATPSQQDAFIVPDEKGSTKPLEKYDNKDVVLRLPEGKTLREINWLSIWSRQLGRSLADIQIPRQLQIPRPLEIRPLIELAHGVRSAPITIVDAQTLLVPDFHYDGSAPAAFFWLSRGSSSLTGSSGLKLKDENGSETPLRRYQGETLVISLPDELTILDYDFFGVWCTQFAQVLGQTRIPQNLQVPPSPKMLGIKPENKLNCEILHDELGYEIRWVLDGDDIVMQLVGKIEPGEYMAFGLGKDDAKSEMENADAVVAWVERASGQVHAVDYFLGDKAQCKPNAQGQLKGSCPDAKLQGGSDSLTLLHGAIVNGYSMVTFKRPQLGVDEAYDQHIYSDGQQSVLWAIGMLNAKQEVGYHRLKARSNMFIDFARNPQWNCPIPDLNATIQTGALQVPSASQVEPQVVSARGTGLEAAPPAAPPTRADIPIAEPSVTQGQPKPIQPTAPPPPPRKPAQQVQAPVQQQLQQSIRANKTSEPWYVPSIVCPADRMLYAQIGPTGAKRGFEALTGRPSWAVSWYINGLLVPEIVLERGQSYWFVVEGGNDKTSSSRRHPLYLTDSQEGGFDFKTDEERQRERVFAGLAQRADGLFVPTAEGRLCEWKPSKQTLPDPDQYPSFSAYQRSLKLECAPGQAGMLKFSPDANTPDLIYYQCYTYKNMGWRIRVVDSCADYQAKRLHQQPNLVNKQNKKRDLMLSSSEVLEIRSPDSEHRNLVKDGGKSVSKRSNLRDFNQNQLDFDGQADDSFRLNNFAQPTEQTLPANAPEISNLSEDMLIVNASQLLNLSNFDQVLKMLPSEMEFIEQQQQQGPGQPNNPFELHPQQLQFQQQQQHKLAAASNPLLSIWPHLQLDSNWPTSFAPIISQVGVKPAAGNKTSKGPKSLQVYMRRLASFYYPVQQQLASILSPSNSTSQSNRVKLPQQQQQVQLIQQLQGPQISGVAQEPVSTAASSSSFSLSSLMSKPKIDLSKSGIGKTLSKLRLKAGWKSEPNSAGVVGAASTSAGSSSQMKPPTPANQFNYDIFNNQLAQLEMQQWQLQALESLAQNQHKQWPQVTGEQMQPQTSYSGSATGNLINSPQFEDHQAIDSVAHNYQSPQIYFGNQAVQQQQQQQPMLQPQQELQQQLQLQQLQSSTPTNQLFQQDPISMLQSNGENYFQQPAFNWQPLSQANYPVTELNNSSGSSASPEVDQARLVWPELANRKPNEQQSSQRQPSIYISRLALPQLNQPHQWQAPPPNFASEQTIPMEQNRVQQQQQPSTWPGGPTNGHLLGGAQVRPLGGHPSELDGTYVTTTSPVSGTSQRYEEQVTNGQQSLHQQRAENAKQQHQQQQQQDGSGESMSSSGSGAYFDIRYKAEPQAQRLGGQPSHDNSDHMLAIERFSRLSSERQQAQSAESGNQQDDGKQIGPHREQEPEVTTKRYYPHNYYPAQTTMAPIIFTSTAPQMRPQSANEIMEVEQSVQTNELERVNQPGIESEIAQVTNCSSTASKCPDALDSDSNQRRQQQLVQTSTQPSASTVLVRPTSIESFEHLPPDQVHNYEPQVTLMPPNIVSARPQIPSAGAPRPELQATDFRSNLLEPLSSTLLPRTQPLLTPLDTSRFHFDPTPFTPIEIRYQPNSYEPTMQFERLPLTEPSGNFWRLLGAQHLQQLQQNLEHQSSPAPPLQVASYLTNKLTNAAQQQAHNGTPAQDEPVNGSRPANITNKSGDLKATSNKLHSELIILKPSIMASNTPQTYMLKPEFLVNQLQDPATTGESGGGSGDELGNNRLLGRQFDRLSSLASPPSTSLAVQPDPMQAEHSIKSYSSQAGDLSAPEGSKQPSSSQQDSLLTPVVAPLQLKQQQQQQKSLAEDSNRVRSQSGKPIASTQGFGVGGGADHPASNFLNAIQQLDLVSNGQSSEQNHANLLQADNKTDNAILAHVMSLITSNAFPPLPQMPSLARSERAALMVVGGRKQISV